MKFEVGRVPTQVTWESKIAVILLIIKWDIYLLKKCRSVNKALVAFLFFFSQRRETENLQQDLPVYCLAQVRTDNNMCFRIFLHRLVIACKQQQSQVTMSNTAAYSILNAFIEECLVMKLILSGIYCNCIFFLE